VIPGYNHNIRYRERTYHVQTEDSGVKNPVIITHLFIGGTILATQRSNYADIVANDTVEDLVRVRMQDQHKAMLRQLMDGKMDHLLDFGGPTPAKTKEEAAPVAAPAPVAAAPPAPPPPPPPRPAPPVTLGPSSSPPLMLSKPLEPLSASTAAPRPIAQSPFAAPAASAAASDLDLPPLASSGVVPPPAARSPMLRQPPVMVESFDAPQRVLLSQPLGASGAPPRPASAARGSSAPMPPLTPAAPPEVAPRATLTIADALGATAANPAAFAGAAAPRPRLNGLFGEDLISDKSLDDVILQYLVADYMAEEQKGKKSP